MPAPAELSNTVQYLDVPESATNNFHRGAPEPGLVPTGGPEARPDAGGPLPPCARLTPAPAELAPPAAVPASAVLPPPLA